MSTTINVLLADDHALVRRGFRRLLEDDPSLRVVGEASTCDEAIALAATLVPDVIVMDAAMPVTNGLLATKAIVAARPEAVVLMLSMHPPAQYAARMVQAGAAGYMSKERAPEELVNAIRDIVSVVGKEALVPVG